MRFKPPKSKAESEYFDYAEQILSKTDEEAAKRYEKYKMCDPFPDIMPALLNSEDIFKYVVATGLIYPFHMDYLRGADYKVLIKGNCIYWDENEKLHKIKINDENDKIILQPNSITYLTLEPTFRVPHYMVLRFNLKVSHVYKGLLLGTGPIVDPGFVGKIHIPLHNLTNNTYRFDGLDELISMEFTKLSPNIKWQSTENCDIKGLFLENEFKFNPKKNYLEERLHKALIRQNTNVIVSSIPSAMNEVKKTAQDAVNYSRKTRNYALVGVIGVLVTLGIGLFELLYPVIDLVKDTRVEIEKSNKQVIQLQEQIDSLNSRIYSLERDRTLQGTTGE